MANRLLEVIVTDEADARAAAAGGVDRLELIAAPSLGGMTPHPDLARSVLAATGLPVRVMIRRTEHHRLSTVELAALARDIESLDAASEFVCGAVDASGMPDPRLAPVIEALGESGWTFHRAIDEAPDLAAAIHAALDLPDCDQVLTAGSPTGVNAGFDRLAPLFGDPRLASGLLIGGGVTVANLPRLLAAGARGIHLGRVVRAGGTWGGPVDADLVRAAADLVHAG
jgi:copper homeostasis protein